MQKNGNKFIAAAVIMCLCFSGMLAFATNSEAINDTNHEMPMFVGDSFSYTPSVNLSGTTISATGNGLTSSGGFLTFASGVLSGTAIAKGTYSVVLTADWTNGILTQSSSQTITFVVYDHTVITSTSYNTGAVVGELYEYTLAYTGNGEEVINVTGLPAWLTWNPATKKISGTPQPSHAGTTTNITVTVSNNVSNDSDSINLAVTVNNDLAWLSSAPTAVVNNTSYTYIPTISSVPDAVITKVSGPAWLTWNSATKILSGTPDLTISGEYQDIVVTLRATSTVLDKIVDQEITIRVWATLDYVTIPTASLIIVPYGMSMMMTYDGIGATSLMFDINGGSDIIFIDEDEVYEPIFYTFEEAGSQMVKLVATNEYGSDTLIMMYDAVGEDEDDDPTPGVDPGTDIEGPGTDDPDAPVEDFFSQYGLFLTAVAITIVACMLAVCCLCTDHRKAAKFIMPVAIIAVFFALICVLTNTYSFHDIGNIISNSG